MARSPEYPQYRWMPPRSYTRGRPRGTPRVIVIHTTEGSEGYRSAEDGAAYDQRRTDGTSAHFYVDADSVVQCVRTTDRAHTARQAGNDIGIHIEVCGRAGQTAAQWNDTVSRRTVEQVAGVCRVLLRRYPFPLVNLTPAQVRAGRRGFCGHRDISLAFRQSTHTDPGPHFPWARLFDLIKEGDMPSSDEIVTDLLSTRLGRGTRTVGMQLQGAAQAGQVEAVAAKVDTLIRVLEGESGDAILTEIRQQSEQTRAALIAQIRQLAPALAAAVAQRMGDEATADEIGQALARELASMLPEVAAEAPAEAEPEAA